MKNYLNMLTTDNLTDLGFINPMNNMWAIGNIDNSIIYIIEGQICIYKSIIRRCETTEEVIKFVESINFLFGLTIEINEYNPYCKLCGGCGEDGCCSHVMCFNQLIKNPKCKYGETYVLDARYAKKIAEMTSDLLAELKSHKKTEDQVITEYEKRTNEIYNEVYY